VVVNEAFARGVFGGADALGLRVRTEKDAPWREIVGIVGDVRQKRLDEPPKPELYETFSCMPMPFMSVVVRSDERPEAMLRRIREAVRRRDPGLAVANLVTLRGYVDAHTSDRRFALAVLASLAGLAVTLGVVGIYGVVSYSVAQRRREMAVRLALGATPAGIRALVVKGGMAVAAAGAVAGMGLAFVAARTLRGVLFGVGSFDATTYAVVPLGLVVLALCASGWPAWQASRVQPARALRLE
jgi:predicted lysophospholipase L1 biosynthesis ABC-type transport system permease subunit